MRRVTISVGVLVLLFAGAVGALASPVEDHDQPWPEHAHLLVLGVEFDEFGEPISVKKCIDLAANKALPLNAHHVHVHFGQAGQALASHSNFVVPTAPFPGVPWTDCQSAGEILGL